MKTLITILAGMFFSTASAQITLEREVFDSNRYSTVVQIDSGEYYYMVYDFGPSWEHEGNVDLRFYDLDFNSVKQIDIPNNLPPYGYPSYITRRLFDLDDSIEYFWYKDEGGGSSLGYQLGSIRVFKESGTVLFACDSCSFGGIHETPRGTKMMIRRYPYFGLPIAAANRMYSLPGKLPGSSSTNTTSAVEDIAYIKSALDIQTVPNPASDRVEINYHLPPGMLSGYIAIRDTKGAELQTHALNYSEGSISVDVRDLSPGSYYCCLLTNDGRTTVKKMMVVR